MKMFEKRRLHPATIVLNIIRDLREAIFPLILSIIFGSRQDNGNLFFTLLPFIIIVITLITGFVSWLRYTYWIEDQELRIEHGVIVRKKTYIPFDRIQSISTSQGILQRIFDLVKLKIETAGGETEAVLTAIPKPVADDIQKQIKNAKKKVKQEVEDAELIEGDFEETDEEEEEKLVFSLSFREVFILALTSGGALGVMLGGGAILSQFSEYIPFDAIFKELSWLFESMVFLILFVVLGAYAISIFQSMLMYANFTVYRTEKNIITSFGLFEKHLINVPLNRIQGIEVEESFIRKLFGFATVSVINAGGVNLDEPSGKIVICPLIKKSRVPEIIENCLPEYDMDVELHRVPKRAKWRYIRRPIYFWLVAIPVAIYFFSPWAYLLLLIPPVFGFFGYLAYKHAGWNISDNQLTLRSRFFNMRTIYMKKYRIQSLNYSMNWFQRRNQLGTIEAAVMSGLGGNFGSVVDLSEEDIKEIYQWYRYSKKKQQTEDLIS